jgi:UDP-glucuronate 4-epimerase
MTVLLTGAAGFIGFHLTKRLVENGINVVAVDNINSYYDILLKESRLKILGISLSNGGAIKSNKYPNLSFSKTDLTDAEAVKKIFQVSQFDIICHLAAQPGIRYSIANPRAYIENNIIAFFNLIQTINEFRTSLFVYASSSSVYGNSNELPFSESSDTEHPVSFYAATKKTNELFAHTYAHNFGMKTIGLRFFTAYGPWGRPDMAYYSFTKNIYEEKPITLFNNGILKRDFTYIDDIITGVYNIIATTGSSTKDNYKIYNIGNHESVELVRFLKAIEEATGKKAIIEYKPMQPGDVFATYADITEIQKDYNFEPTTDIEEGIQKFVEWYRHYYGIKS